MDFWQGLLTVVSNFVALPVALKWYGWGHAIVPLFFLWVLFWSSGYHSCDSGIIGCMLSNYGVLHDLDFWGAQMVVTLSFLHLIYWVSPHPDIAVPVGIPFLQTAFIFFFGLINALIVILTDSSPLGQVLTTGAAGLTLIIYWIAYAINYGRFPRYNYRHMVVGLSFTGSSLLLFNLQNQVPELYWLIHSMWHAMGLCGAWYWASVMPIFPAWLNVGTDINSLSDIISSPINIEQIWKANTTQSVDLESSLPKKSIDVKRRHKVDYSTEKKGI